MSAMNCYKILGGGILLIMTRIKLPKYLQGVSFRNGLYELALTDIDMQVRFGLKMVLEC